jgi:proline iminopeptidase
MTPDEYTLHETFLDVGDGHSLYIHDWGNAKAKLPIIFLHGGPGSGSKDKYKTGFDPEFQRVIFFDQRGCGRSLPYGSLEHNTTADLVEDIEKIATYLKLKKFVLNGGSWGCALALAYTIKYPQRVKAMVLSGIFTCSKAEIEWLDKGQFVKHFPDVWDIYVNETPKAQQANPSKYHFAQALGTDEAAAKASAYAYENLEGALLNLDDRFTPDKFDEYDPTGIKIEIHYLVNDCFLPDHYILHNASKLKMPIHLVQGRYDMVCPPITAYELHHKLPNSWLTWTTSGHKAERETWSVIRTLLLQLAGET